MLLLPFILKPFAAKERNDDLMPEVLTQAQIDEMLKSVSTGQSSVEIAHKERRFKEYDFRAPKKFTKEQIKILDAIFESYARLLSSYFTSILRIYSRVSLITIEEQKYNEFNNALPDYVIMGIVDLGAKHDDLSDTSVIIQLSNSLTFSMIDRLLGGKGEYKDVDRDFTEIELSIMNTILKNMVSLMKEPWISHVELHPVLQKIETNSRVAQIIDYDETVIIVMLEVEINAAKSIVTVCMPALDLDAIIQKFSAQNIKAVKKLDAAREKEKKDTILDGLNTSSLDIKAVLGEVTLDMHEVLTLRVNDIIPLNKSIDSNVVLEIGESAWFDGKLGLVNGKKAVKIDNVMRN